MTSIQQRLRDAGPAAGLALALFVLAFLYPQYVGSLEDFPLIGDFIPGLSSMVIMIIVTMMAVGLNIVVGYAGLLDLGYVAFYAAGAYTAAWFASQQFDQWTFHFGSVGISKELPGIHLSIWLVLLIAGVFTALAGILIGLPTLRLRGDYLAIVTLGFGEIVRVFLEQTEPMVPVKDVAAHSLWSLMDNLGGAGGFKRNPKYIDPQNPFWVWVFVALVLIVAYRLKASSKGRQLLAVRENEIAAEAMGVPTTRVKVNAFVIAAFFAGIGGGLFAHELGNSLNPGDLGFQKSIDIVIMVVLGGMGSITGVVAAATILTVLPELFREFAQYRMIVYALALILMMILRPQGLFGIRELWELGPWRRVFRRRSPGAGGRP